MKYITKNRVIMSILLLAIALVNIYYLQMKSGYFVDEGMTLFLANGNYNGAVTSKSESDLGDFFSEYVWRGNISSTVSNVTAMLKELSTAGNYSEQGTVEWYDAARNLLQGQRTWVDGTELFQQITVSRDARFQYVQVYLNQAMDVHPPLYYIAVHTVFSLFPDTFSNLYLFAINIVALLLACIFIYKSGRLLFSNSYLPFLAVALYGFSQGFISCAAYFRMYALLSLFVAMTVYLHLLMKCHDDKYDKRFTTALVATVVLGFYTHYYYIIFLFLLFLLTTVRLIKDKKRKEVWRYIRSMIYAGLISLFIWPLSVYHILFGYRGTEAVSNLITSEFLDRLTSYWNIFSQSFFYGSGVLLFGVLLAGIAALIYKIKKCGIAYICLKPEMDMIVICAVYWMIVSQIAPVRADRYIICLYPMIALLLTRLVSIVLVKIKNSKGQRLMVSGIIILLFILALTSTTPNYLFLEQKELKLGVSQEVSSMNCLMISDDDWRGFPVELKLAEYKQVIVLGENEMQVLEEQKPADMDAGMIIYIYNGLEETDMLHYVTEYLGYSEFTSVESDIEEFDAFYIS